MASYPFDYSLHEQGASRGAFWGGMAMLVAALAFLAARCIGVTATAAEPQPNALERVMAVQDRNTPPLMSIEGVVGTATGLDAVGRPVIKVFIAQPGVRGIPARLEREKVEVEVTGEFFALAKAPNAPKPDPKAWFPRPVPIGVSTGHPNVTAGTIGCRVTDGSFVCALSNNHVYADCNNASLGDDVLQPGPYDGGGKVPGRDDVIGRLDDFSVIDFTGSPNFIDAAIAISDTGLLGNATPSDGYGTPKSTTAVAKPRLKVKKYGRTTRQTSGTVTATNGAFRVNYGDVDGDGDNDMAYFQGQIVVTPGSFAQGGDSGSLVVTQTDNKPVGLLFAGSTFSVLCNPIGLVLGRFDVSVDGPP